MPLFAGCKNNALEQIQQLADEVDVPDGYALIREGTFGEQFFLIVQGRVRIERGGQTIRTMGPGEYLGEVSLIDKGRTTATATTEGPARLFVLGHREFNSLLDRFGAGDGGRRRRSGCNRCRGRVGLGRRREAVDGAA